MGFLCVQVTRVPHRGVAEVYGAGASLAGRDEIAAMAAEAMEQDPNQQAAVAQVRLLSLPPVSPAGDGCIYPIVYMASGTYVRMISRMRHDKAHSLGWPRAFMPTDLHQVALLSPARSVPPTGISQDLKSSWASANLT